MPSNSTGSKRKTGFGFNAKNREAQRWANEYAGDRITNLNEETKLAIRDLIEASIREGVAPKDAAEIIKRMVGLNRPQGIALRRYVDELSPSLSVEAKAKAGLKLKEKMIRRRAITIARTEVIDSLSAGSEQSWIQAQDQGFLGANAKKAWISVGARACVICRDLNRHDPVPLEENFESLIGPLARPTAHPNCRCGIAPVPGEGGMFATTRVGITSFRPNEGDGGDFTNRTTFERMNEYRDRLEEIEGVTGVQVRPAVGAWEGAWEPSWAVSYRGNGEARRLAAEFGQLYNQDAVLMMQESNRKDRNGVTIRVTFDGAVSSAERATIAEAGAKAFGEDGGWTWSKREGNTQLTMTSVESFNVSIPQHRTMVNELLTDLRVTTQLEFEEEEYDVKVEILNADNYAAIQEEN